MRQQAGPMRQRKKKEEWEKVEEERNEGLWVRVNVQIKRWFGDFANHSLARTCSTCTASTSSVAV